MPYYFNQFISILFKDFWVFDSHMISIGFSTYNNTTLLPRQTKYTDNFLI